MYNEFNTIVYLENKNHGNQESFSFSEFDTIEELENLVIEKNLANSIDEVYICDVISQYDLITYKNLTENSNNRQISIMTLINMIEHLDKIEDWGDSTKLLALSEAESVRSALNVLASGYDLDNYDFYECTIQELAEELAEDLFRELKHNGIKNIDIFINCFDYNKYIDDYMNDYMETSYGVLKA